MIDPGESSTRPVPSCGMQITLRAGSLQIVCPFCSNGTSTIGRLHDPNGQTEFPDGSLVATHDQPPCQMFIDLDPDEYLAEARKAMEKRPKA